MKKCIKNSNAFTIIELLIATGLLSLVILSAFSLSSSSNKSFEAGSWRIARQKTAQLFLLRFKETIERANHANQIAKDGEVTRIGSSRDIVIAAPWYNQVASSTNSGILFASSTSPYILPIPEFRQIEKKGIWKGFSLECFNKTLVLLQTGKWERMLVSTPISVGTADVGKFVLNNTEGDFLTELPDVDSIAVFTKVATDTISLKRPEMLLTLQVTMVKPNSKGLVKITEEITVRVLDRKETEIVKGGSSYPSLNRHSKS